MRLIRIRVELFSVWCPFTTIYIALLMHSKHRQLPFWFHNKMSARASAPYVTVTSWRLKQQATNNKETSKLRIIGPCEGNSPVASGSPHKVLIMRISHVMTSSYDSITVTSWWARWRLKSPASRLFAQPFCSSVHQRKTHSPKNYSRHVSRLLCFVFGLIWVDFTHIFPYFIAATLAISHEYTRYR